MGIYDKAKGLVMKGMDAASEAFGGANIGKTTDDVSEKINDAADAAADRVDDIKEAFEKGAGKLMDAWDKLEKSGKIEEVMGSIEKVAKKASETVKTIADDVAEIYKTEDAEQAVHEEFKDEEEL